MERTVVPFGQCECDGASGLPRLAAPDRYLIATDQKIEPHIYGTQAEAECAAETLAFRSGKETGVYRLSDAGLVSSWVNAAKPIIFGIELYQKRDVEPFRPDGSSWLDKPAEAKP